MNSGLAGHANNSELQSGAAELEKRVRALQKKLRRVQQLEEKQAGGHKLNPDQKVFIMGKMNVVSELYALGLKPTWSF